MTEMDERLKPPEYEVRALKFVEATPWRLHRRFNIDEGYDAIIIDLGSSDMWDEFKDQFIQRLEGLADADGFVSAAQVPGAQSGDFEVDATVGWNVEHMKADRARRDIVSADNFTVSGDIHLEEVGVTEVTEYRWDIVRTAFGEICADAARLVGKLDDEISALVYRRHDDSIVVQLYFSFLFNDEIVAPAFDVAEATARMEKLIVNVLAYQGKGSEEFTVQKGENN